MQRIIFLLFFGAFLSLNASAQCPPASPGYHRVQKGETLYKIARDYQVTVDQLCEWNNIRKTDVISVCQELAIRAPKTTTEGRPISEVALARMKKQEGGTHVIQEGETIAGLAELYGFTEKWFREFNGLNASEPAWPGLVLKTTDCICPSLSDTESGFADTGTTGRSDEEPYPTWDEFTAGNEDAKSKTATLEEDPFYEGTSSRPLSYEQPTGRIPTSQPTTPTPQTGKQDPTNLHPEVKRSIKESPNAPEASYVPAEERLIQRQSPTTNTQPSTTPAAPSSTSPIAYLSTEEIDMIREINLVRSNPPAYTRYIEDYKQKILKGTVSGSMSICDELIAELKQTPKLPVLVPSRCLFEAARQHGLDQLPTGSVEHLGTDGSYPWDRVRRACPNMTDGNENLVGGPAAVRDAVILLLLDENIPGRGHRRNILSRDWKYVACYKLGRVGSMPNMWIQQFGK